MNKIKKLLISTCMLFAFQEVKAAPMLEFFENLDWSGFFDKMEADFDICSCEIENADQYPVGFKMRFVEPIMGVSVSSIPWHIVGLDIKLDNSMLRKQGVSRSGGVNDDGFMFKHVNSVIFPILGWTIGVMLDYICFERGTFLNMAYFSELDPTYNSDVLGLMAAGASPLSRVWFANPLAEAACAIDCASTTISNSPMNSLFYCNGCNGSALASDTGYNRGNINIPESETILFRYVAKAHGYAGLVKTADVSFAQNPTGSNIMSARCKPQYFPTIIKEQYYAQLPNNDMQHMGKMMFNYDFKSKPNDEDAVFFWLWRMRDICVGATVCRSTFTGL